MLWRDNLGAALSLTQLPGVKKCILVLESGWCNVSASIGSKSLSAHQSQVVTCLIGDWERVQEIQTEV